MQANTIRHTRTRNQEEDSKRNSVPFASRLGPLSAAGTAGACMVLMESSLAIRASICLASSSLIRSCQAAFCILLPLHCMLLRRVELAGCRGSAADPNRGRIGSGCGWVWRVPVCATSFCHLCVNPVHAVCHHSPNKLLSPLCQHYACSLSSQYCRCPTRLGWFVNPMHAIWHHSTAGAQQVEREGCRGVQQTPAHSAEPLYAAIHGASSAVM